MKKGKHEVSGGATSGRAGKRAASGAWDGRSDPFAEDAPAGKTKKKLSKGQMAGLIAGGSVLALILLAMGWWIFFVKAPDVSDNDRPVGITDKTSDIRPGNASAANPENDGDGNAAVSGRKEDVYTFLLLGKDTAGGGNTDTMILVAYDVPNGTVNCMSIPRDTMVNVSWDIKRINSVYMAKESSGGGIEGVKKHVGLLTGVTPDFYIIIEWKAVGQLVDALGGVEFDVPYNMNYDDPYQDLHIHQSKGLRVISGSDAMQIVRFRGYNEGDVKRMEVQQLFLKAVAKQCLQLKNWTKISDFAKIFFENVETDLPLNNLLWFAQQAMGVDIDNLSFVTMPGNYEGWAWSRSTGSNQAYVFAYPAEVVELVNESFNPYNRDITEDDLQIMYKNKDGTLGITNGAVLDTRVAGASGGSGSSRGTSGSSGTSSTGGTSGSSGTSSTGGTSNSSGTGSSGGTNSTGGPNSSGTSTSPGNSGSSNSSGGIGGSGSTQPSDTQPSGGEPTLPSEDTPSVDPATATDPAGPGAAEEPGTAADPGTVDSGAETDPAIQLPEDGGSGPQPEPQPEPTPDPVPELPPEPELPPGE